MRDCNAVVNLLGRDHETGHYGFRDVHVHGASLVARCAADAGAARLVHLSCMGASHGAASARLRAHAEGEAAVRAAFPGATILRPAPVFGPEDGLLNAWARAARALPVVPLIDGGAARLAPVEARDVAQAVAGALRADASAGATYHLAGPDEFTAAQLVALVFRTMRERPRVAAVPAWAARLAAAPRDLLQTLVPFPLPVPLGGMFTRSGVDEFAAGADYTLPVGAPCGLAALGVASPRRLAGLNIDYLRAYRAGGYDFGHTAGEEEEEEGAAAPAPAGSAAAAAARGRLPS